MLNREEGMTTYFTGGTVYRAFLSPIDYHRSHDLINGTIEKFEVVDGI